MGLCGVDKSSYDSFSFFVLNFFQYSTVDPFEMMTGQRLLMIDWAWRIGKLIFQICTTRFDY